MKTINVPILVVDDNKCNRDIIKAFLLDHQRYNISLFENGNKAYEYIYNLKNDNPVLLITDILMPDIDGLTLLNKLRNLHNVYSIVITGHGCTNDLKEAFDAGAIDFIRKPIEKIELISRVDNVIRNINTEMILKKVAITDFLTGAYNRKYFIEQSEKEIRRAKRYKYALSFVIVDIDDFKEINDIVGHLAGDKVLKSFCSVCKNLIRGHDYLCRFGGDEFAMTLTNSDMSNAQVAAERIKNDIENLDVIYNDKTVKFTVSMGITELSTDKNETTHEILARADKALYKAKNSGKNMVCCVGPIY